jgi:hypothetical protein
MTFGFFTVRPARLLGTAACIALVAALPSHDASAKPPITSAVRKACAADYKKLCPGLKVGSTKLRRCMRANSSELSPGCINALLSSGQV